MRICRSGIIATFGFLALFLLAGSCHAASVDVDGWTFTTDLESWRVIDNFDKESYDSSDPDWASPCGLRGIWKGTFTKPFYYPEYPNAPKGNENYDKFTGFIYISVLKIPEDLRQSIQEHDIAVYGSLEKIPNDIKEKELNDILRDATRNALQCDNFDSEKDITFGDRTAHLSEGDDSVSSDGAIAILLDNDTVGIIEAYVLKKPYERDGSVFNGRAWDVIDSFTISPK